MKTTFGRTNAGGSLLEAFPFDVVAAYPEVGFPPDFDENALDERMLADGVVRVHEDAAPSQAGMVAVRGAPALVDGLWRVTWTLEPRAGMSFEQRAELLEHAVQAHMDTAAQALGYDDLATAVTYAEEPAVPKFQGEGLAFRAWRSKVWAFCYWLLDEVAAGRALEPTPSALFAVLPTLELPE